MPIAIVAVKRAMQIAETARRKLTVECATLRGMVNAVTVATRETPEAARDELTQMEHPAPQPATPPADNHRIQPYPALI
ncbi:MAG: hypothetical protein HC828_03215 [Blastochloris sp.]|nr:hypothetical protein [Blastochloris sp.]